MKDFICEVCKKEYQRKTWKNRQTSRFCSRECHYTMTGTWVKGNPLGFKWEECNEQQIFERLKLNYEKLVIRKNGCWDWKGNTDSRRGYGRVVYRARNKSIPAHVASWKINRGKIPKGMCVLHKCDNRSCTNPDHLFLGTNFENVRDMVYKNRQAKGSNAGQAKLTEDQVKEIRQLLSEKMDQKEIAKKYNITQTTVSHINIGKTWRHI